MINRSPILRPLICLWGIRAKTIMAKIGFFETKINGHTLDSQQRTTLMIQISDFIEKCPAGYAKEEGDLPGWGSELGSGLSVSSLKDCGRRCDNLVPCLSFEHSRSTGLCNLNTEAFPAADQFGDYMFCRKYRRSGN